MLKQLFHFPLLSLSWLDTADNMSTTESHFYRTSIRTKSNPHPIMSKREISRLDLTSSWNIHILLNHWKCWPWMTTYINTTKTNITVWDTALSYYHLKFISVVEWSPPCLNLLCNSGYSSHFLFCLRSSLLLYCITLFFQSRRGSVSLDGVIPNKVKRLILRSINFVATHAMNV